ncbi:hypothetical protein PAMP_001856 [Pampus punctatissimus]
MQVFTIPTGQITTNSSLLGGGGAVFSGLCREEPSQQDDPSCWPHAPEPCLVLSAQEDSTF